MRERQCRGFSRTESRQVKIEGTQNTKGDETLEEGTKIISKDWKSEGTYIVAQMCGKKECMWE